MKTLLTTGFGLRLAALATALLVGPAALAPGTAEAPATSALAGEGTTAAQRYGWRVMQWDYAWEFGEDLDSPAYRGANIRGGKWLDYSTGTGRAVKSGGGIEFHTGERYDRTPDFGVTRLTLSGKAESRGRWELKERTRLAERGGPDFEFVVELVPEGTAPDECPDYRLTVGRSALGGGSVRIGVNVGARAWTKTLTGYGRTGVTPRLYAVQITRGRITWFLDSRAVASTTAAAAIPKVPLTLRMSVVGSGTTDRDKADVLIDWVRNYDLTKGLRAPTGQSLITGSPGPC
ncbi:hypothetical protein D0Z08_02785 [Nocardioides immobilis]|uniref:GH16 domain-containing protein n=1 Tax=Nocardioides immobilis TaxID=2049295 RepID=A0A417Y7S1_9ACTN|nr:hypothetical protein [Nocardioides immobilis]RHW28790.1 hypothetical protein D0Z08_02785 [Nocardioides immobilis]